jgi:hypothetical protein
MARDEAMHQLLLAWAQWLRVGDGSGYPTMSVLHEDWTPPSPGVVPTLKVAAPNGARRTDRVLRGMSRTLYVTALVHYCYPSMTVAKQADRLGCCERTVYSRVEQVQVLLREALEPQFCNMQKVA